MFASCKEAEEAWRVHGPPRLHMWTGHADWRAWTRNLSMNGQKVAAFLYDEARLAGLETQLPRWWATGARSDRELYEAMSAAVPIPPVHLLVPLLRGRRVEDRCGAWGAVPVAACAAGVREYRARVRHHAAMSETLVALSWIQPGFQGSLGPGTDPELVVLDYTGQFSDPEPLPATEVVCFGRPPDAARILQEVRMGEWTVYHLSKDIK